MAAAPPTSLASHEWAQYPRVIVFDGVCNWCNAWVDVVLRHDQAGVFRFGTLQSDAGHRLLRHLHLPTEDFETFILLEGSQVFTKSTAALRVLQQLPRLTLLAMFAGFIPLPIRDAVYGFIARNRYRWMGRRQTCRVPTAHECNRFV